MHAHNLPQRKRRLRGMIERNPGNVVMQDVGLNSTVEEETTNPSKVAVDS